ncbi:Phosphatidylserine decarboxylase proenzyme, mitochondrial [Halotydeus destructor]|nr:Phosphatidylserine decarboxylase proenzyme, mitochondrial [Halotydeus destructor]
MNKKFSLFIWAVVASNGIHYAYRSMGPISPTTIPLTHISKGADPFSASSQFWSFTLPAARTFFRSSTSRVDFKAPFRFSSQTHLLCPQEASQCLLGISQIKHSMRENSYYDSSNQRNHFKFALKFVSVSFFVVAGFFVFKRYRVRRANEQDTIALTESELDYQHVLATDVEVMLFKLLPLKIISRIWGWFNALELPPWMCFRIISWYSRTFNCCLDEAECCDIESYKNLGDFFRRPLKAGVRPIDDTSIVSPADGVVVHFGKADAEKVEQVKGVTYSLRSFLGPQTWSAQEDCDTQKCYMEHLKLNKTGTSIYHCVIYLAPGDYHRFHSPADWTVKYRRHFSGKLLSIRPSFMSWIQDLFTLNERVSYMGSWPHGFFSMTAVGATNVGSVRVYFDEALKTNQRKLKIGQFVDRSLNSVQASRGSEFGEFNLGSTIVLVFEAPDDIDFAVKLGHRIKYGQSLFNVTPSRDRAFSKG